MIMGISHGLRLGSLHEALHIRSMLLWTQPLSLAARTTRTTVPQQRDERGVVYGIVLACELETEVVTHDSFTHRTATRIQPHNWSLVRTHSHTVKDRFGLRLALGGYRFPETLYALTLFQTYARSIDNLLSIEESGARVDRSD